MHVTTFVRTTRTQWSHLSTYQLITMVIYVVTLVPRKTSRMKQNTSNVDRSTKDRTCHMHDVPNVIQMRIRQLASQLTLCSMHLTQMVNERMRTHFRSIWHVRGQPPANTNSISKNMVNLFSIHSVDFVTQNLYVRYPSSQQVDLTIQKYQKRATRRNYLITLHDRSGQNTFSLCIQERSVIRTNPYHDTIL